MSKRLSHTSQPVGIHPGNASLGVFLFGIPFIGCGVWIGLIGTKVIEVDPSTVHAPYWLLTLIGILFGGGGLLLWNMALQRFLQLKRIQKLIRIYPDNPAAADYDWNPSGYSPPRWKPTFSAWTGFVIFSLFGAVSFWISFMEKGTPWFVKGMSIFLGLIIIWVAAYALKVTWHAFKYGKSLLVFNAFPFTGSSVIPIEIQLPMDLHRARSATLTFRQIEEFYEIRRRGSKQSKSLIQSIQYEAVHELSQVDLAQWPRTVKANFELPENAATTQLTSERPRFWHIELELDMPGLDFKQRYLVPIY